MLAGAQPGPDGAVSAVRVLPVVLVLVLIGTSRSRRSRRARGQMSPAGSDRFTPAKAARTDRGGSTRKGHARDAARAEPYRVGASQRALEQGTWPAAPDLGTGGPCAPGRTAREHAFEERCHAGLVAGGMSGGRGPTLAARSAVTAAELSADPELAALRDRPRPVLTRHCWVTGLPGCPGRWGTAEWRQDRAAGGWQGRVVYAVDDGAATVIVEAWVPARHLQPAG